VQDAPSAVAEPLDAAGLARLYPNGSTRSGWTTGLLSFFTQDPPQQRHVVLRDKELLVHAPAWHIAALRPSMLPDEATLCATCWMHGVFAAQLTIGKHILPQAFFRSRATLTTSRARAVCAC